jgi:hypothetical protein
VLDALRELGEADVAAIRDQLERKGAALGDDPEKRISNALFVNLRAAHKVARVEDRRGYWKATDAAHA